MSDEKWVQLKESLEAEFCKGAPFRDVICDPHPLCAVFHFGNGEKPEPRAKLSIRFEVADDYFPAKIIGFLREKEWKPMPGGNDELKRNEKGCLLLVSAG